MAFEYDNKKSISNKEKHGIDFVAAQALWDDDERLELPARIVVEERYLMIGKVGAKHWTAVFTYRNEKVRIISVRRSRKEEIVAYES